MEKGTGRKNISPLHRALSCPCFPNSAFDGHDMKIIMGLTPAMNEWMGAYE